MGASWLVRNFHHALAPAHDLVSSRRLKHSGLVLKENVESTVSALAQFGFRKIHGNDARVRAGFQNVVMFKLTLIAVVNEIDSGIEFPVLNSGKLWDIRNPLTGVIAQKINGSWQLMFVPQAPSDEHSHPNISSRDGLIFRRIHQIFAIELVARMKQGSRRGE